VEPMIENNHCFALFYKQLSDVIDTSKETFVVSDSELIYRMTVILRMTVNDQSILFNRAYNVFCCIAQITKKKIVCTLLSCHKNQVLNPFITLYLPLLKRNHLEDAISLAGQVGVCAIQLVITERSGRQIVRDDRLERILIGACEQAKHYIVPPIYQPISLSDAIFQQQSKASFVCTQDGMPFSSFQERLQTVSRHQWECGIFVGPEQDFTRYEYELFAQAKIQSVLLGSLVLQASVAACISVALVRASFITKK
jgi:RsmE family RNA methyltransferase